MPSVPILFGVTVYKLLNEGWFWVLGVMIGEDLQIFFQTRIMRIIAIGTLPIRNLPKNMPNFHILVINREEGKTTKKSEVGADNAQLDDMDC
ncbi:hypothetical protein AVEN_21963-1 [Araneus ventricosus]|uniref:Uncharacterized protein n=1 Tax=Araneus ventricosus TaxID=182803 RepID=A0A4Y2NPR5_ARAVE|nr:hypothetical protein AVEN_21963-1 [Araneus ventricosus]